MSTPTAHDLVFNHSYRLGCRNVDDRSCVMTPSGAECLPAGGARLYRMLSVLRRFHPSPTVIVLGRPFAAGPTFFDRGVDFDKGRGLVYTGLLQ